MNDVTTNYPFVDLHLARRIERTEGEANAAFVEARAEMEPEAGAAWTQVAGAYVLYDGPDSPLTQTFGLGLFEPVEPDDLDRVESYFRDRGAPVYHEVSPLATAALGATLAERGYRPVEMSSVLFRPTGLPLPHSPSAESGIRVRELPDSESDAWARVLAEGWRAEMPQFEPFILGLSRVTARSRVTHCFLAELEGVGIAAGSIQVGDGVALLAGASTVPAYRRRGAQAALLQARLQFAAQQGADLAVMLAEPGSTSQRNAERQGFRIAYTRTKWGLGS
jgi:GNAT superfamily N-acetyltransferase